jgi:hypothetical protein
MRRILSVRGDGQPCRLIANSGHSREAGDNRFRRYERRRYAGVAAQRCTHIYANARLSPGPSIPMAVPSAPKVWPQRRCVGLSLPLAEGAPTPGSRIALWPLSLRPLSVITQADGEALHLWSARDALAHRARL